jgi:hypothetical protein
LAAIDEPINLAPMPSTKAPSARMTLTRLSWLGCNQQGSLGSDDINEGSLDSNGIDKGSLDSDDIGKGSLDSNGINKGSLGSDAINEPNLARMQSTRLTWLG